MPITTLRRSAFLVTLLLSNAASAQVAPRHDGRTFAADSFWIRKWLRGGSKEADLLTEPRQVIVAGNTVVVLDEGTREVFAFDIANGQTRLNMKALGEGPGEFRRPARIVQTATGFAVLDHATARLTAFDSLGRMQWDAPLVGAIGTA